MDKSSNSLAYSSIPSVGEHVTHQALITVCANAEDVEDAKLLIDMLGLKNANVFKGESYNT